MFRTSAGDAAVTGCFLFAKAEWCSASVTMRSCDDYASSHWSTRRHLIHCIWVFLNCGTAGLDVESPVHVDYAPANRRTVDAFRLSLPRRIGTRVT